MKIKAIYGREIIDSRGNPTVEAQVELDNGTIALGAVPSGASTGKFEALELRDNDIYRFNGKGVKKAVENINKKIAKTLIGMDISDIYSIDKKMIELDRTENKSKLGANAILAVSIASVKAASDALRIPLYKYLGGVNAYTMPIPMMNIINGGLHASNSLDIQEFMIMPVGAKSFKEGLRQCCEVYHSLQKILKKEGMSVSVGDEGGFAPNLKSTNDVIEHILSAIESSGYKPYKDFMLSLDAASSEWKLKNKIGKYKQPKSGKEFTTDELISYWENLIEQYPIYSIEDGLDEEDWDGWEKMTKLLGNKVKLVGDDLFVTNPVRLKKGIKLECANSILIKPNQIGTISETMNTIKIAQNAGYKTIISHRSGETEDTTIADLSVAINAGYIKTGAPSRGERVAKYNRLLRIEEELINFV